MIWNSTDDRLRRIIWRCNGKYAEKGKKGCDSRHIDDGVLYQAFVDVFNAIVDNKDHFIAKWQGMLESDNALVRYKAKQFVGIVSSRTKIDEFDINLYFAMVEKITVVSGKEAVVSLIDGAEIACEVD